jgi:hypothetical protein
MGEQLKEWIWYCSIKTITWIYKNNLPI